MNFLRHTNLCSVLKSSQRLNLLSISLPCVPLHSDSRISRLQDISACSKTKVHAHLPCLRNNNDVDILRRAVSTHRTIANKNGFFSQIKSDIDPYARLIRFDRPIGNMILDFSYIIE